jgi:pantetheine-phosphate adenylyltransferase
MKKAVYAGSFDPMTKGHFDIVEQALMIFDEVVIGIGVHPKKQRLFSIDETISLILQSLSQRHLRDRIVIKQFDNALVHFARDEGADAIVRGLRQATDFNDEFIQHGINSRVSDIPITYFICHQDFLHVSSSSAKQMVTYGLDVDWLVDGHVASALSKAIGK